VLRCLPLVLLALAACGGADEDDDADQVRQTVRDFVRAANQRDGDRLCGELITQEYKEKSTGAVGDAADRACRQQLELTVGLDLDLISVGRAEVKDDVAAVRAVIDTDGVQAPRSFRLEREDGRWKLAAGG
jgi:hypothetical protein